MKTTIIAACCTFALFSVARAGGIRNDLIRVTGNPGPGTVNNEGVYRMNFYRGFLDKESATEMLETDEKYGLPNDSGCEFKTAYDEGPNVLKSEAYNLLRNTSSDVGRFVQKWSGNVLAIAHREPEVISATCRAFRFYIFTRDDDRSVYFLDVKIDRSND